MLLSGLESLFLENGLINISRFITFSFIHLFVFKWFFKFSRDSDLVFLMDYQREGRSSGICILISFKIHIREKGSLSGIGPPYS